MFRAPKPGYPMAAFPTRRGASCWKAAATQVGGATGRDQRDRGGARRRPVRNASTTPRASGRDSSRGASPSSKPSSPTPRSSIPGCSTPTAVSCSARPSILKTPNRATASATRSSATTRPTSGRWCRARSRVLIGRSAGDTARCARRRAPVHVLDVCHSSAQAFFARARVPVLRACLSGRRGSAPGWRRSSPWWATRARAPIAVRLPWCPPARACPPRLSRASGGGPARLRGGRRCFSTFIAHRLPRFGWLRRAVAPVAASLGRAARALRRGGVFDFRAVHHQQLPDRLDRRAPAREQISVSRAWRCARSSPSTRILISSWAPSARSASASTARLSPASPIITTGSRWWARARKALRSAGVSAIGSGNGVMLMASEVGAVGPAGGGRCKCGLRTHPRASARGAPA